MDLSLKVYTKIDMAGPVKQLFITGGKWTLADVRELLSETFPGMKDKDIQVAVTAISELIFMPMPETTLFGPSRD